MTILSCLLAYGQVIHPDSSDNILVADIWCTKCLDVLKLSLNETVSSLTCAGMEFFDSWGNIWPHSHIDAYSKLDDLLILKEMARLYFA